MCCAFCQDGQVSQCWSAFDCLKCPKLLVAHHFSSMIVASLACTYCQQLPLWWSLVQLIGTLYVFSWQQYLGFLIVLFVGKLEICTSFGLIYGNGLISSFNVLFHRLVVQLIVLFFIIMQMVLDDCRKMNKKLNRQSAFNVYFLLHCTILFVCCRINELVVIDRSLIVIMGKISSCYITDIFCLFHRGILHKCTK